MLPLLCALMLNPPFHVRNVAPPAHFEARQDKPTATAHADVSVKDTGAVGDAATDDTAAFQRALDKAGETGGVVEVPPGRYLLAGTLNVPESVTLEGSFRAPERTIYTEGKLEKEKGSILLTTAGKDKEDGTPFITLNRCSTLKGLIVFYPEQTFDVTPYPWCVRGNGDNCSVVDCLLINPYQAVDFGTNPCGRHYIDGLYGQPLKTGLFIDKCLDVGRVENVHFWPFWTAEGKIWDWTSKNGTAFLIAKTDWEYMSNCFDFMYAIGYHFIAGKDGPGNAVLTQCGSDTGPCAVKIDSVQPHAGVSFENGQFMSTVIVGQDNQGPVKFTSCGFWGVQNYTNEQAIIHGFGQTTFTACHFVNGAQRDKTAYAIDAFSGGLTVSGCEFLDTGATTRHIHLGPGVRTAVLMGNTFRAPIRITNQATGQVAVVANVTATQGK
ncbi:MAG TPA: glycosyl hydrolase family 28-related protein [Fimbriimonas sp.]|nr:glycosyl hydrolase family 28-related protein [Fimbriimonas sp.]